MNSCTFLKLKKSCYYFLKFKNYLVYRNKFPSDPWLVSQNFLISNEVKNYNENFCDYVKLTMNLDFLGIKT